MMITSSCSLEDIALIVEDNDDYPATPNQVLFMDGYWLLEDQSKVIAIRDSIEVRYSELLKLRLLEKVMRFEESGLLPKGLTLK